MMDEKLEKWIIKALEDYKTAEHELRLPDEDIVTSAVCFHCQQFVEKSLKTYLFFKNTDFGRTHNLEILVKLCSEEDISFKNLDVGNLTDFAVEIRYPDDFYIPTIVEAKECFAIAKKVKEFVFGKLKIE